MAKQLTAERRRALAQILVRDGSVRVGLLADQFGVSTETIRKDLIYLEEQGIAEKSHGGAIAASRLLERPYNQKSQENTEEKKRIAQLAASLIPEKGAVILDAGSTTLEIAKLLTLQEGLTVFTNSISILQTLATTQNRVFVLGGHIRHSSMALVGGWVVELLNAIEADIAFIGTDGFRNRQGPCTASFEEVQVKKAMIKSSKQRVLVGDYSKFSRDDMFQFAAWQSLDYLITDGKADLDERDRIGEFVEILVEK